MDPQQMAQIDSFADKLINSTVLQERRTAEEALAPLSTVDGVQRCRFILEYSSSPFSQHVAAGSLKKVVQNHWQAFPVEQRKELKNYLLNYMANKASSLAGFVVTSLVALVSCVIKVGWLDSDENQEIVNQLMQFTNSSIDHCILGLEILHSLVNEMNVMAPNCSLTSHRKASIAFRNNCLLPVFHLSTSTLANMLSNTIQGSAQQLQQVCDSALRVGLACLSYDFIGSNIDDYSDEVGTIQLPASWKSTIEGGETLQRYFDLYTTIDLPCTVKALECLVQLASVRQSLFHGEVERQTFLSSFVNNTCNIMRNQTGLNDPAKFHELCRLLFRLKANFQITMLVRTDTYQEWIQLTANLTIGSFNSWQWNNNSIFYLLSLWSRLVASTPYLKGDLATGLDVYVPQIVESYISVRLQSVQNVLQNPDQFDDPLQNEELVIQELENLAPLCRFNYTQGGKFIGEKLDQTRTQLASAIQVFGANPSQEADLNVQLYEGQLAWVIYIVSLVIASQGMGSSSEPHELMDGQLAGGVLQFIMTDSFAAQRQNMDRPLIDLAVLSFLQNFRKKHIGDNAMASSKVFSKLKDLVGLSDHLMVVTVTVNRIVTNCKLWATHEDVIRRTLDLLCELSSGYSSGKMLLKIQSVMFLLANHGPDTFPFLLEPCNSRHRTTFYGTLSRLFFLDESAETNFAGFISPVTAALQGLSAVPPQMWNADAKPSLIGAFRDIRGVFSAAVTRRSYLTVLDWLYPEHFPVFIYATEMFFADSTVMVPLLKCLCELVNNRAQRMAFDVSSPMGILLFRETSKILAMFANGVLSRPVVSDIYVERYKCISTCFQITTRVMAGGYVNFGVFELYGDEALNNALTAVVKLFLSIPADDLMAYPKLTFSCFQMLEVLFRNHTKAMTDLDPPIFEQVLNALHHGLRATNKVQISTHASSALDHLCNHCFKLMGKDVPAARSIAKHLAAKPDLLSAFTSTLFNLVVFDDVQNLWSLSRPLLGLILLDEMCFARYREQLILSYPPTQQPVIKTAFDELMQEVGRNLDVRNKDRFTQNFTIFRSKVRVVA